METIMTAMKTCAALTGLMALGLGALATPVLAQDDTIKVGILHSLSGTMASDIACVLARAVDSA